MSDRGIASKKAHPIRILMSLENQAAARRAGEPFMEMPNMSKIDALTHESHSGPYTHRKEWIAEKKEHDPYPGPGSH